MVSEKLIKELLRLEEEQHKYAPSNQVARQLENKTLVMVVGPACAGKTTVIDEVSKTDGRFGIVGSFTTRDPRADEGGKKFAYIPHTDEGLEKLFRRIKNKEVVQYMVHPTTKHIYGSDVSDFAGEYNLLDAIASSVDQLRTLPFKHTRIIGLVAGTSQWLFWFNSRFPAGHPERENRGREAVTSLRWLLGQPYGNVRWVINEQDKAEDAARETVRISLSESKGDMHGYRQAELCLEAARRMV